MKKSIAFLGIMLFLGGMFAAAGPVNGKKFEFGTALSFFSFNQDDSPDDLISFLNIPVRFGWFFWKGFEIEPEIILTIPTYKQGGGVSYLVMGHLTYNFSASEKLVPFVGFGAGFGNGVPYFGTILGDSGIKAWALDGIAGVRYLIVKSAALRAEYRFSRYFYDASWTLESRKATHHQFFVGLSIFF